MSRCDRQPYETKISGGTYAFEELGSAFTMASLGLSGTVQDHASYIQCWMRVLRADKKAIFKAAALAQKAHEWITTTAEEQTVVAV